MKILMFPNKKYPCDHAMLESVYAKGLVGSKHEINWLMSTTSSRSTAKWHKTFVRLFPNTFSAATVLKRASAQREAFLWEKQLESVNDRGFVEISGEEFIGLAPTLFFQRLMTNPGTVRTPEYLRWRYLENPSGNYRFIASINGDGLAVVKQYDEIKGHIVDIVAAGKESFLEVINGSQQMLSQSGVETVSLYPLALPESQWLQEAGFRRNNWGRRLIMFAADKFFPAQEVVDSWYLTMNEHSIF